jgi:hypothetical protein
MTTPLADQVIVSPRYCGPPRSGNGGYVSGLLAHELRADHTVAPGLAVEVSLRQPPPLGVPLDVLRETTADGASATLGFGGAAIAQARTVAADIAAVDPVGHAEAVAASAGYPGWVSHPFPTCFACGVERPDGLRIFPGPVAPATDGSSRVAAAWTPGADEAADYHEYDDSASRVCLAATWAALDCIGGWAGDLSERLMVLGRMTAIVDELPLAGEPHVVMGQALGRDGRKTFTASTLYDPDGRIVGRARHIWFAVDPATFNETVQESNR